MDDRDARLEFLKSFLAERDVPCPMCKYNLRGLAMPSCPECGSEIEIAVGLTEPRMGAFIAGAVGLAMGVGFNGLILGWVGWVYALSEPGPPRLREFYVLPIGLVVTLGALVAWLLKRKKIRMSQGPERWVLAALCYLLSLGSAVMFFSSVR